VRLGPSGSYVSLELGRERVRLIGRHHFLVKSKSERGVWHCVDLGYVDEDWPEGGCTCEGYSARKDCSHVRLVLTILGLRA
jgi:hypothetical protein